MGRQRSAKTKTFPPNLYQNAAGYYYYTDPDKRGEKGATRGLGKDKAKAFAEARAANAVLATRAPSSLADWMAGKQDYSLAEWIPLYRELWIKQRNPAPTTLRNASAYMDILAATDFAWRKLRDITTAQIAQFIRETSDERGASSALLIRSRLSDVFRMAETQGLIDMGRSPVAATYTPKRSVKRERLSLEQFYAIREQAPIWLQRGMDVALLTGQRREDIVNMKFADVKDGYLHIVQGKGKDGNIIRLRLDLNIRLEKAGKTIGDAMGACRDLIVSRHLIHHVANTGPSKPGDKLAINSLTQAFQAARDKAGIVAADGRTPPSFHEIRSLAQRLYREQYGPEFAQAILGHKNAKTTAKYDDLRGQGWMNVQAK